MRGEARIAFDEIDRKFRELYFGDVVFAAVPRVRFNKYFAAGHRFLPVTAQFASDVAAVDFMISAGWLVFHVLRSPQRDSFRTDKRRAFARA